MSRAPRRPQEGYMPRGDRLTWYRIAFPSRPSDEGCPLLLLHGGPGQTSDYLSSLEALTAEGRMVVRYDQLGSGRSNLPAGSRVENFAPFIEELTAIRAHLGLDRIHLMGHSWGGMVALEYMLTDPPGVESLILASAPFSSPLWVEEMAVLRHQLPSITQRTLQRCEGDLSPLPSSDGKARHGARESQIQRMAPLLSLGWRVGKLPLLQRLAYLASAIPPLRPAAYELAQLAFLRRHVCRLSVPPIELFRSQAAANREMYRQLWGSSEFHVTGSLKDWDLTARLERIAVPTLVTSGRFDEATPRQMAILHESLPGSQWALFEGSSHLAHLEEPDRYNRVLADFLSGVERQSAGLL
jgi:pimeloyl-ACP methyl ester carboxylesterase